MKDSLPILEIKDENKVLEMQKRLAKCQDFYSDNLINHIDLVDQLSLKGNSYWEKIKSEVLKILESKQFVIVKNLPFDFNNFLFTGFASFIGNPVVTYTDRIERIVRDVSPVKGKVLDPSFAHTDSTFWPIPNDITALQCVKKDEQGNGKSRIVRVSELLDRLPNSTSIIKKFTKSNYPFVLDPRFGNNGFQLLPILSEQFINGKRAYQVRFNLSDTKSCLSKFGLSISDSDMEDLVIFERTASQIAKEQEFLLDNGDLLLFDNHRTLHSRSRCESDSNRLVRMIKMNY